MQKHVEHFCMHGQCQTREGGKDGESELEEEEEEEEDKMRKRLKGAVKGETGVSLAHDSGNNNSCSRLSRPLMILGSKPSSSSSNPSLEDLGRRPFDPFDPFDFSRGKASPAEEGVANGVGFPFA